MHINNLRKESGVLFLLSIFAITLALPIFTVLAMSSVADAATLVSPDKSGHYTWTSVNTISGTGGTQYLQMTTDDTGRKLILAPDQMVLERDQPTCNDPVSINGSNQASTDYLDVQPDPAKGDQGTGPIDAKFAHEVLIVKPYASATSVTYVSTAPDCTDLVQHARTVPLTNIWGAVWLNSTTIRYGVDNNATFTEESVNNGIMTLNGPDAAPNGRPCGPQVLTVGDGNNSFITATTGALTISSMQGGNPTAGGGTCQTQTETVYFAASLLASQVATIAHWVPNETDPYAQIQIDSVGSTDAPKGIGNNLSYDEADAGIKGTAMTLVGNTNTQGRCSANTKPDSIVVDPYQTAQLAKLTTYTVTRQGSGRTAPSLCTPSTSTIVLTNLYGGDSPTPTNGNPVTTSDGCNVPTDNEPLRWIECPVISTLEFMTTKANAIISSLLEVPMSEFFNSGSHRVFNMTVDFAVSMLIIAAVAMVASQAADLEFFAAHTVRKALPRIIIAAILISLSWPLLQFVIGFFNDMGLWVGKIILSAADALPNSSGGLGDAASNYFDALILSLVSVGAIAFLGAGGIISLFISIFLFVVVGVFVLMFREVAILLCIYATPLGLAAYLVFPGMEKFGRFWKDTFLAALVMFPLVEAFLATGTVLAFVTASIKSGNYFYHVMALAIFAGSYFMIPLSFRIAGGLVGRVAEFAQGTHRKTIESRLQGYRQNVSAKNTQALKAGSRWNPNSRWTNFGGRYNPFNGRGINFLGRHVGAGMRGRFGLGAVGSAAMANNMALSADAASKMDTNFAAQMNNEEAMAAVAFGNDRRALSNLTYFNAAALARVGSGSREQLRQTVLGRTPGLSGAALDRAIDVEAQTTANNRLNSALAAGRTIQATQQMQTAAADALIRSGKVLDNRSEFNAMVDSISHGNTALAGGQRGALQYTARQIGREDLGRNDDYDALKEMDMATVARQKPKSLENLFGNNSAAILNAINRAAPNSDEQQHFADILFAAQNNQSLSPEQQRQIAVGVRTIQADRAYGTGSPNDLMAKAALNYRNKIAPPSDRRLKQNIRHIHTLGNGIKLYSFQYKWGGATFVGVMAQDLLQTHPEAVLVDPDGYYRVRYDLLGLEMVPLEKWSA